MIPPQHRVPPTPVYHRVDVPQIQESDGTWGTALPIPYSFTADHLQDARPGVELDAEIAAKLAVMEVLLGLRLYELSWTDLVRGRVPERPPVIRFTAGNIALDWPDHEKEEPPSISATIRVADAGLTYDGLGLSGPDLDEDSVDVYAPGTVLAHTADVVGTLVVELACASKTIREGVRKALADGFEKEPHDWRGGRRIVVRPYFDRICRIELGRQPFATPDDESDSQRKSWPLLCFLDIDIPRVRLVAREPIAQRPPVPRLHVSVS